MAICYIGVGSNLGDREGMIDLALRRLEENQFVTLHQRSPVYETEPVGYLPQARFLNAVLEVETDFPPEALFRELMQVERYTGRERVARNGPRTLDLDLLAYGNWVLSKTDLTLPHPRLHERMFVLQPFADVNPNWIHPRLQKSVKELLANLVRNPSLQ